MPKKRTWSDYPVSNGDGYVYVIGTIEGSKKIGYTNSPIGRFTTLQSSTPSPLEREFIGSFPEGMARTIEKMVHRKLSSQRVSGEWFDVSLEEAVSAIKSAAAEFRAAHPETPERPYKDGLRPVEIYSESDRILTPAQCRMARAYMQWSQADLGARSGVSEATILNFETLQRVAGKSTRERVRKAFEEVGFRFFPTKVLLPCPNAMARIAS